MEDTTMIYKAVPGPTIIGIKNGDYQGATDSFAQIINANAKGGWKFYSMETIITQEKVGCIKKEIVNTTIYMLIFCKEESETVAN